MRIVFQILHNHFLKFFFLVFHFFGFGFRHVNLGATSKRTEITLLVKLKSNCKNKVGVLNQQ